MEEAFNEDVDALIDTVHEACQGYCAAAVLGAFCTIIAHIADTYSYEGKQALIEALTWFVEDLKKDTQH